MDYSILRKDCVEWIRDWFERNGKGCPAVLGMSGGKDSTVAAALCAEALGPGMVTGVALPSGEQSINEADEICSYLGINYLCCNIGEAQARLNSLGVNFSQQAQLNIPPRIRMTVLYAIAQSLGGRVVNTCNLSEDYIGYATRWGDSAGDFSPLANLTVQEVRGIGHDMGIPSKWVDKIPDDGLPHSCPDEQKFGFTYEVLDRYIRTGVCEDPEVKAKIDRLHRINAFKMSMPEAFIPKQLNH